MRGNRIGKETHCRKINEETKGKRIGKETPVPN